MECPVDTPQTLYNDGNHYFYDRISDIKVDCEKKAFHFYHLEGTHYPFKTTTDFTESKTAVSIEDEGRGMMVLINTFLKKLKEEDIYKNSTIIIMADHGHYDLRQNPLFLVKGKNVNQNFSICNVPVSYFNLQSTYLQLLDGLDINDLLSKNLSKDSERLFFFYEWDNAMSEYSHSTDISIYSTTGKAWNYNTYKPTGIVYSVKH